MSKKSFDVAIVGAGACGLACALHLKTTSVVVFDKKSGARKLSITGNNRCNLTNILPFDEFLESYGKNGKFLRDVYSYYFRNELLEELKGFGVEVKIENNKVYLSNMTSRQLANILLKETKKKAAFKPYESVNFLRKNNGLFEIRTQKGVYFSKVVVLACGGMSYPHTGSDGSCYNFAQGFNHEIVHPRPMEVAFCSSGCDIFKGLSFQSKKITLNVKGKKYKIRGDFIFTHFGISGPAIFELSKYDFNEAELVIDFLDTQREDFINGLHNYKGKVKNFACNFVPLRFATVLPFAQDRGCRLSKKQLNTVANFLSNFKLKVKKCGFDKAFVTAGGVSLKGVSPKTLESKLAERLFFCGEILNIQGPIGGFNLQFAFSSGVFVAKSINDMYL